MTDLLQELRNLRDAWRSEAQSGDAHHSLSVAARDLDYLLKRAEAEQTQSEARLLDIMQDVWNDHIMDTGTIPADFQIHGPRTSQVSFRAGPWAHQVACRVLTQVTAPQREAEQPSQQEALEQALGVLEDFVSDLDMPEFGQDVSDELEAVSLIRAALQRPRVPEGWQLVPKKPTDAMIHAAENYHREYVMDEYRPNKLYVRSYRAMLAAAPEQPAKLQPWEDDAVLVARAMQAIKKKRDEPFWSAVKAVFQHGSGFSQDLCRRFGLDPETGQKIAAPDQDGADQ